MNSEIRRIIALNGRLTRPVETLGDDDDLFAAGLNSLAIINVMLVVEETYDIAFPDELLNRQTFASFNALIAGIEQTKASVA